MNRIPFDDLLEEHDSSYSYKGKPYTGLACEFYPNSSLIRETEIVSGRQKGTIREWYENGQLASEGVYFEFGLNGPYKEWYPNGQLKEESMSELAICLASKEWDENGLLIKTFALETTSPNYEWLLIKRSM